MSSSKKMIITATCIVFCLLIYTAARANTGEFQSDTGNSRSGPSFAVVADLTRLDAWDAVASKPDGTFIVAGHAWDETEQKGINLFMKYDNLGTVSWAKTAGLGYMNDLTLTSENGFCLAGRTYDYGSGESDFLIMNHDSNDELIWAHTIGGTDSDSSDSIMMTPDGGFIVAGDTNSYGAGSTDVLLVKCNADGEIVWATTAGGSGSDYCRSACITEDGGCVVVGETVGFGVGSKDLIILKFGSQGQLHWSRTAGTGGAEWCDGIAPTSDGGCLVSGAASIALGSQDFLIIKYNTSGIIEWARALGENGYDRCYSIVSTSDGGSVVGGSVFYQSNVHGLIAKLSSSGELIWSQLVVGNLPEADYIFALNETADDDIILSGCTKDYTSEGQVLLFAKTNPMGTIQDCPLFQPFSALIQDVTNDLYVTLPEVITSNLTINAVDVTDSLEVSVVSPSEQQICLSEPTPTVTPTPTITPTPTVTPQDGIRLTLDCPDEILHANDTCYLDLNISNTNTETLTDVPLFCLMEVSGMYWYYPTWTTDPAWELMNSIAPGQETISIFPEFLWPANVGAGSVMFWGVLTDSQLTRILGLHDTKKLSWE